MFAAIDADFKGHLASAVCVPRQLYFWDDEKGDEDWASSAALVASENAPPQRIPMLEHLSYSLSPTVPFVICLPAGGASVA